METYPYSTILTTSGRRINPLALKPEDVCIRDIAMSLANQNRFGGHLFHPYNVAVHSLNVCSMAFKDGYETQLLALLHDATEAVLVDLPRPYKQYVYLKCPDGQMRQFAELEAEIMQTILEGLHISHIATEERWAKVKEYDNAALDFEKSAIAEFWAIGEEPHEPAVVFPSIMACKLEPDYVIEHFISTFKRLKNYVSQKTDATKLPLTC